MGTFKSEKSAVIKDIEETFLDTDYEDALDIMRDEPRFDKFLRKYKSAPGGDNIEALWSQAKPLFKVHCSGFIYGWIQQSYQITKIKV